MFKNVTIRARLTLALGLFMVLLVVGAAVGLVSLRQSNASLQEIYSNDMASSRSLAQTTISTPAASAADASSAVSAVTWATRCPACRKARRPATVMLRSTSRPPKSKILGTLSP